MIQTNRLKAELQTSIYAEEWMAVCCLKDR
jgi:hypothetical protein